MPTKSWANPENTATWQKYAKKLCKSCRGTCCSLPVEVKSIDLVRMGLVDSFELEENPKFIARRLIKEQVVEHYHGKSETFTLARMANGDCLYLDRCSRRCTIYEQRPETCRNHPHIGPRPGFCAYIPKSP